MQVLALPAPLAGPPPPPSSTQAGTRSPFIQGSSGVGGGASNVRPLMSVGCGVVNGASNSLTNQTQPSMTDIAAGALLIASVVQGQWHCIVLL